MSDKKSQPLAIGKLDSELLKEIVFEKLDYRRDEVLTRPGIGEDCAVIDYGEYECVLSTDPITASIEDIGHLAVHISCNDVASNGIQPVGLMLAVMLPEGTTQEDIEKMMEQAGEASRELGVEIIGGHTEITTAVKQPLMVSTAVGRAPKGRSQAAKDMAEGDAIIVTKQIGLEGTGIIAKEKDLSGFLTEDEIAAAKQMIDQVSVVREGVIAGDIGTHGMHDVTEGGILGAVWEMCHISGMGAEIDEDSIPMDPVTEKICSHFGADPLRMISSGCMLIVCPGESRDEMIMKIRSSGVMATCIGRITGRGESVRFSDGRIIDPPGADEIYRVLDS